LRAVASVDGPKPIRAVGSARGLALFSRSREKGPIFFACELLNVRIASGVGCSRTVQPFPAKYASASGDRRTLPNWPEPRTSCYSPPMVMFLRARYCCRTSRCQALAARRGRAPRRLLGVLPKDVIYFNDAARSLGFLASPGSFARAPHLARTKILKADALRYSLGAVQYDCLRYQKDR
jgi:hypothetical protein